MSEDLKPCPFCGGKARIWSEVEHRSLMVRVGCRAARCLQPVASHVDLKYALKMWTKRTP